MYWQTMEKVVLALRGTVLSFCWYCLLCPFLIIAYEHRNAGDDIWVFQLWKAGNVN